MRSTRSSRRRLLATGVATLAGLAGCLSGPSDTSPDLSPSETDTSSESVSVASLSVADFIVYPLAGDHPHVHRAADTQYVVVSIDTDRDAETVRKRLALELDGETVELASRQPAPWRTETVERAFAVSKARTTGGGRLLSGGLRLTDLSAETVARLNSPPVFEVSEPSVQPAEISADEQTEATVTFGLANTGTGAGTFGASLKGNYVSGAATVTVNLDAESETEAEVSTSIVGDGEEATVRFDWGADEWVGRIPVV